MAARTWWLPALLNISEMLSSWPSMLVLISSGSFSAVSKFVSVTFSHFLWSRGILSTWRRLTFWLWSPFMLMMESFDTLYFRAIELRSSYHFTVWKKYSSFDGCGLTFSGFCSSTVFSTVSFFSSCGVFSDSCSSVRFLIGISRIWFFLSPSVSRCSVGFASKSSCWVTL